MSESDWKAIPGRLKAAGFTVFYERVSYAPENPLWCANAHRGDRAWSSLGRDLRSSFVELEKQTLATAADRRTLPREKTTKENPVRPSRRV